MQYLFEENIDAVVPDNQFRKRNPVFGETETYNRHKENRKKTRNGQRKRDAVTPSEDSTVDSENQHCICPAGKELHYLGDHFETASGRYTRFRGELKDCRTCQLQTRCMKTPVTERRTQQSILNTEQSKTSYVDLIKNKTDSEEGRTKHSRRIGTIEPAVGKIWTNKRH
ncbi:MAG: transposase, partial [Gammaproteobacteria bacterium]|nr:transposase [Gammaproteobacteria bacterium]